jgi:hypothetical protein
VPGQHHSLGLPQMCGVSRRSKRLSHRHAAHRRLAILGVTDQYIHQRMDPSCYIRWRQELEGHVTTHNGELEVEVGAGHGLLIQGSSGMGLRHECTAALPGRPAKEGRQQPG